MKNQGALYYRETVRPPKYNKMIGLYNSGSTEKSISSLSDY